MRVCESVFSVGFGPGLGSMSPARSRRSPRHAAGTQGWIPQKLGDRASGEAGYVDTICTPITSRLYPFGARQYHHPRSKMCIMNIVLK